jgi:hypothetical protein
MGIERPDLLVYVEELITKLNPRKEKKAELIEVAIWTAINELAQFSQTSVIN